MAGIRGGNGKPCDCAETVGIESVLDVQLQLAKTADNWGCGLLSTSGFYEACPMCGGDPAPVPVCENCGEELAASWMKDEFYCEAERNGECDEF